MMTEENSMKKEERQYNSLAFLNLIRLILAISIVLWNFPYGYSEYNGLFPDSLFAGWRDIVRYGGNQAFLIISGMLFYYTYYKRLDQKGRGGYPSKTFYGKESKESIRQPSLLALFVI